MKNEPCRFKFGNFFSKEKIVGEPLQENMPEKFMVLVLRKRNEILDKVREFNNFLNPSKIDFYDPTCDDFIEVKSVSKVLEELNKSMKMH